MSGRFGRECVSLLLCVHGDVCLCEYDSLEPPCGHAEPSLALLLTPLSVGVLRLGSF